MTGIVKYVKESFEELKSHVSWPGFNEGLNLTVLVAVFSVIFFTDYLGVRFYFQ